MKYFICEFLEYFKSKIDGKHYRFNFSEQSVTEGEIARILKDSIIDDSFNELNNKHEKSEDKAIRDVDGILYSNVNSALNINLNYHKSEIQTNKTLTKWLILLLIIGVGFMATPIILHIIGMINDFSNFSTYVPLIIGAFTELISATLIVVMTKRIKYYHENLRINEINYQISVILLLLKDGCIMPSEKTSLYKALYKLINTLNSRPDSKPN